MSPPAQLAAFVAALALLGCGHAPAASESTAAPLTAEQLTPGTLAERGLALMQRGDYLRAEQYLQLALRAGHAEAPLIVPLLTTCIASSRFRAALAHAERHLALYPQAWRVRFVKAAVLRALGQPEQADLEHTQALRDAPTDAQDHLARGDRP